MMRTETPVGTPMLWYGATSTGNLIFCKACGRSCRSDVRVDCRRAGKTTLAGPCAELAQHGIVWLRAVRAI